MGRELGGVRSDGGLCCLCILLKTNKNNTKHNNKKRETARQLKTKQDKNTKQLEKHLNDWDIIAIDIDSNSRLIRNNAVIYQLHCLISPDTTGCDSNFFYHCPECDGHIYQCNCLRNSEFVQSKPKTEREIKNATIC